MNPSLNSRIVYLGEDTPGSTSGHRIEAMRRLGVDPVVISSRAIIPKGNRAWFKLHRWTGYRWLQSTIAKNLQKALPVASFDLAWIDSGWWAGPPVVKLLKQCATKVMVYNLDDPSGPREPHHWKSLLRSLPLIDFAAVVRQETQKEFQSLGCKNVLRMWRCYDEVAHHPDQSRKVPGDRFHSDVCFIGTWMEDRHLLVEQLLQKGVPLSIWGNGWQRAPNWSRIQKAFRGSGILNEEYVAAIARAKICFGTLSRLNRDLHTTRSSEIPYAGGVLCMPRTSEHERMFPQDNQAILWRDLSECSARCMQLLREPDKLEAIRREGRARIQSLRLGNEDCLSALIEYSKTGSYRPHTVLLDETL